MKYHKQNFDKLIAALSKIGARSNNLFNKPGNHYEQWEKDNYMSLEVQNICKYLETRYRKIRKKKTRGELFGEFTTSEIFENEEIDLFFFEKYSDNQSVITFLACYTINLIVAKKLWSMRGSEDRVYGYAHNVILSPCFKNPNHSLVIELCNQIGKDLIREMSKERSIWYDCLFTFLSNYFLPCDFLEALYKKEGIFKDVSQKLYNCCIYSTLYNNNLIDSIPQSYDPPLIWDKYDWESEEHIELLSAAWALFERLEVDDTNAALLAEFGQKITASKYIKLNPIKNVIQRWKKNNISSLYKRYIEYGLYRLDILRDTSREKIESWSNSTTLVKRLFYYTYANRNLLYSIENAEIAFKKDGANFVKHIIENDSTLRGMNKTRLEQMKNYIEKCDYKQVDYFSSDESWEYEDSIEIFISLLHNNYNLYQRLEDNLKHKKPPLLKFDKNADEFLEVADEEPMNLSTLYNRIKVIEEVLSPISELVNSVNKLISWLPWAVIALIVYFLAKTLLN